MKEEEERLELEVGGGGCYSCPVRSARSCLPSSAAPPVKRGLSGERIHFSVETPHTQSSESCSYATSWYLLPVSPINYSPKYRSQGKETPRMGQKDRAALSTERERPDKESGWWGEGEEDEGESSAFFVFCVLQPTICSGCVLESSYSHSAAG